MSARSFTIEQETDVVARYQAGESSIKISKSYGVDKSTVLECLKRSGVIRRTNRLYSDAEEKSIALIYSVGNVPAMRIAMAYNTTASFIFGVLDRQGVASRGNYIFSAEEELEIAKEYSKNKNANIVAKKHGCDRETIRRVVVRNGMEVLGSAEANAARRTFDTDGDKKVKELYESGLSMDSIRKIFGARNRRPVINSLKRSNTNIRDGRLHHFNEEFFDDLSDEHSAYWLGFIYADGYVGRNSLVIGLGIKDTDHLRLFQRDISSTCELKSISDGQGNPNREVSLALNSAYMTSRLRELGIIPFRGHFDKTLRHLPEQSYRAFLRGFMDGDGCISKNYSISFVGQPDILSWVKGVICSQAKASEAVTIRKRKNANLHDISWGGKSQIPRIVEYIYDGATIWMQRKRSVADGWQ